MRFEVLMTEDAERDLQELYSYIAENDSPGKADALLNRIEGVIETLTSQPNRGTVPRELSALGVHEYRQLSYKPYRVIYRVIDNSVYIYLIADGRRDFQTLLTQRLLRS